MLAWEYWNGSEWIALDLLRRRDRGVHAQRSRPAADARAKRRHRPLAARRPRVAGRAALLDPRAAGQRRLPARAAMLAAVRTNTVPALQAQTRRCRNPRPRDRPRRPGVHARQPRRCWTARCVLSSTRAAATSRGPRCPTSSRRGPTTATTCSTAATGEVRFGRGAQLRVPIANPNRPANVIALQPTASAAARRATSAPGGSTRCAASVPGIDADAVANLIAAAGGTDEETLDAAQLRAAAVAQEPRARGHGRGLRAACAQRRRRRARQGAAAVPSAVPGTARCPAWCSVIVVPPAAQADPLLDPAPLPTEGHAAQRSAPTSSRAA